MNMKKNNLKKMLGVGILGLSALTSNQVLAQGDYLQNNLEKICSPSDENGSSSSSALFGFYTGNKKQYIFDINSDGFNDYLVVPNLNGKKTIVFDGKAMKSHTYFTNDVRTALLKGGNLTGKLSLGKNLTGSFINPNLSLGFGHDSKIVSYLANTNNVRGISNKIDNIEKFAQNAALQSFNQSKNLTSRTGKINYKACNLSSYFDKINSKKKDFTSFEPSYMKKFNKSNLNDLKASRGSIEDRFEKYNSNAVVYYIMSDFLKSGRSIARK